MNENPDKEQTNTHERYMRRCFELARLAFEQRNTSVGSLVVLDGEIIGTGFETLPCGNDVTGHAELLACQSAVTRLNHKSLAGATLYSTAEPCIMCSYVIRNCELRHVVYCLNTPTIGGVSSSVPVLVSEGLKKWKPAPTVIAGILKDEFLNLRSQWKRESKG